MSSLTAELHISIAWLPACKCINKQAYICPAGIVKAYYLRGKAHVEVWNEAEARQDFSRVLDLNPGMKKAVKKELAILNMRIEEKNEEDKLKYKGMFWPDETESWSTIEEFSC